MNSFAPTTRRVRAYFAPVARATATPTLWDPAGLAAFNVDAPPAPWLDLGWCSNFKRQSATRVAPLLTGAPATAAAQVRTEIAAELALEFESWGKLQLALSSGVQQLNILAPSSTVPVAAGSTATTLEVGAAASAFAAGNLVVVDADYAGTTGFVGAGISGNYIKSAAAIGADTDYVRRVSLNVALVTQTSAATLTLAAPLLAGSPTAGMQVAQVVALCDREGGSFFQEWSALFITEGDQGDRIAFHYPRLQAMAPAAESSLALAAGLDKLRLPGRFRALPIADALDGEAIVCYRAYLPAPGRNP
jgi:hypothetical protein